MGNAPKFKLQEIKGRQYLYCIGNYPSTVYGVVEGGVFPMTFKAAKERIEEQGLGGIVFVLVPFSRIESKNSNGNPTKQA